MNISWKKLTERLWNGAPADQRRAAAEYISQVVEDQQEENLQANEAARNWNEENERWGASETPPAGDDEGGGVPYERSDIQRRVILARISAWAAFGLELPFAAFTANEWVSKELALPALVPPILGILFAVSFTLISKSLWTLGFDHTNPTPEVNRLERRLKKVAILAILAISIFVITRLLKPTEIVVAIELGMVSIILPIYSAGAFVLAKILGELNKIARRYRHARRRIAVLQNLINRMNDLLRAGPVAGAILLIGLFLFGANALEARTVKLWLDTSGSLDAELVEEAYGQLAEVLIAEKGLSKIEVFGFAGGLDALRMPKSTIVIPKAPPADDCNRIRASYVTVSDSPRALCKKKNEELHRQAERQRATLRPQLLQVLRRIGKQVPSPATCLFHVLRRAATETSDTTSIILSDGHHEACARPACPSTSSKARVIVILVPRKGDDMAALDLLDKRMGQIRAFSPQAVAIPLFQVSAELPKHVRR